MNAGLVFVLLFTLVATQKYGQPQHSPEDGKQCGPVDLLDKGFINDASEAADE